MKLGTLNTDEPQRPYAIQGGGGVGGVTHGSADAMTIRTQPARSPLENVAAWLRSLRYEDMMQMSTEMHALKIDSPVETPEQLAKLLHAWAKATTEPTPQQAGQ